MSQDEYNRALSTLGPETGDRRQINRLLGIDGLDRSKHAAGGSTRHPVDQNKKAVSLAQAKKTPGAKRSGPSKGIVRPELDALSRKNVVQQKQSNKRVPRHMREEHGVGDWVGQAANSVYNNVLQPGYENFVKPTYEHVVKPVAMQAFNYAPEILGALGSMKGGAGMGQLGGAVGNIGRNVASNYMDRSGGAYASGGGVHQGHDPRVDMRSHNAIGGYPQQMAPQMHQQMGPQMAPQMQMHPQMMGQMQPMQHQQQMFPQQRMPEQQMMAPVQVATPMMNRPMFNKGGAVRRGGKKGSR